jgi:DNA-binding GntR family transcriptional regulator
MIATVCAVTSGMRKETRADAVHGRLRADILAGRLEPGERLKFPDLCERYEASVGVTREALARLAGEGLVSSEAHQGFMVMPLSEEELADLTTARLEVESSVLRHAVADGDVAWEAQVVSAHHVLARTPLADPDDARRMSDEWARAHAAFHDALLAGCGNRRLLDIARGLRGEADLYLRWSVSLGNEPERGIEAEHRGLMDAVLARDADLAVTRLREHIAHTKDLLVDYERTRAD